MASLARVLFFAFISLIFGGLAFLAVRNGAFREVTVDVGEAGPMYLVSVRHVGPYHKVMPSLERVETWAKEAGVDCPETYGEYLDDPNVVEMERLRSNVGCVLKQPVANSKLPEGFSTTTISRRRFLIAKFDGSPALGPYKVYNKVERERAARHLEADGAPMEVYRVLPDQGLETTYLFPVREP